MKPAPVSRVTLWLLAAVFGSNLCNAGSKPLLQWDPATVSDCREWFDNSNGDSCESIRHLFDITPQQFHDWNPSVGLDCKPWRYQSYCILTEARWDSRPNITTTSEPPSTTTSRPSHLPTPFSWNMIGCYIDSDDQHPVLQKRVSPDAGDQKLTVSACEEACWKASLNDTVKYAGVRQGNQCWCGDWVDGTTANNQTECSTPCSGKSSEVCGGAKRINVWEPVTTAGAKATATAS